MERRKNDNGLSLVNINLEVTYLWIYSINSWKYGPRFQEKYADRVRVEENKTR